VKTFKPALMVTFILTALTGIVYPLAVWGIAQVIFPSQAGGSLVVAGDKVVGSRLIGQNFSSPRYFQGRPSAAGDKGYDAANSGGSNLGPTNKSLIERVQGDIEKLKQENASTQVPADLVTTSGSGLDPHISPEAALFQVPRVAKARNLPENRVRQLVAESTSDRIVGLLGEPRVNVLELNLALDRVAAH
jgi:K+-transporting ATPase ATPase C chain